MALRSWVLKSWPEVRWHLPADLSQGPLFHHMGTEVGTCRDEAGRPVGETVWVAELDVGQVVGAAWEWVEVLPGVPAIRDPNGFITNLRFEGADGEVLLDLQATVELNRLAHAMDWQSTVRRAVAGEAVPCGRVVPLAPLVRVVPAIDPDAERLSAVAARWSRRAARRQRMGARAAL